MTRLSAAIAALLLCAPASAQVDFDQGVDVKALLAGLPPAPSGIALTMFRQDPEGMTVAFVDRQARLHVGGTTRLVFAIKEDRGLLPDPVLFDMDMAQPVGPYYEFSFKDIQGRMRPGARYYVEWSCQRSGEELKNGGRSAELVCAAKPSACPASAPASPARRPSPRR